MSPTRNRIVIVLISVALLGVCWEVLAQEVRSLWEPPPVMPSGASLAPSKTKSRDAGIGSPANDPVFVPETPAGAKSPPASPIVTAAYEIPPPKPNEAAPIPQAGGTVVPPVPVAPPMNPPAPTTLPGAIPVQGMDAVVPLESPRVEPPANLSPFPPLPAMSGDSSAASVPSAPAFPPIAPPNAPNLAAASEPMMIPPPKTAEPSKELTSPAFANELPKTESPKKNSPAIEGMPAVAMPSPLVAPGVKPEAPRVKIEATAPLPPEQPPVRKIKSFERFRAEDEPQAPKAAPSVPVVQRVPEQAAAPAPPPSPPSVTGIGLNVSKSESPSASGNGSILLQLQTPILVVEKRGASLLRPGAALEYLIVVRNLGASPAEQVRIEDDFPLEARLIKAEPAPRMQGNKAIWVLPVLPARGEQVLRMTLHSVASTEFMNRTSVHLSVGNLAPQAEVSSVAKQEIAATTTTVSQRPRPSSDALAVKLIGPKRVAVGKQAVFDICVTNRSALPVRGMVLYGSLPEGLSTPEGGEIEGAVDGILLPGESKTLKMPTSAVKAGRYTVKARVASQEGFDTQAQTDVEVGSDTLQARHFMSARLFAGRDGDCRIELTNPTDRELRNVAVVNQLPDGLDFVAASDRGLFQANSRTVHWLIDRLAPGETRTLSLRVHALTIGEFRNAAMVRADGLTEVRCVGTILVENHIDLSLKVIDRDNPLEMGRATVYEIHVLNPGGTATTNVRLQVQFPPGLLPRAAEGVAPHTLERQTVAFEPLAVLGPQGKAIYRILAVAHAIGDQRIRCSVSSDHVQTPMVREHAVMVYQGN